MVSNSCILDTGQKRIVHPKVRTIKSSPGSEVHKLWPECALSTKGCKDHRYQWYRIFYPSLIYGAVFMLILWRCLYLLVAGLGRFLASLLCMSKYPRARCWTQLLLMHTSQWVCLNVRRRKNSPCLSISFCSMSLFRQEAWCTSL